MLEEMAKKSKAPVSQLMNTKQNSGCRGLSVKISI